MRAQAPAASSVIQSSAPPPPPPPLEGGVVMVSVADALLVPSACATAVILTLAGDGTLAGAVYTPAALMVPTVALPPATPFTCQVTAVLVVLPSVAARVSVEPVCTLSVDGHTSIWIDGATVEQPFCPAVDGALLLTELGVMTTSAVSVRPASSVTVSATVATPHEGAVTLALEVAAPEMLSVSPPLTGLH